MLELRYVRSCFEIVNSELSISHGTEIARLVQIAAAGDVIDRAKSVLLCDIIRIELKATAIGERRGIDDVAGDV